MPSENTHPGLFVLLLSGSVFVFSQQTSSEKPGHGDSLLLDGTQRGISNLPNEHQEMPHGMHTYSSSRQSLRGRATITV